MRHRAAAVLAAAVTIASLGVTLPHSASAAPRHYPPFIEKVSPIGASPQDVLIEGQRLGNVTSVDADETTGGGEVQVPFSVLSDTQLRATIPPAGEYQQGLGLNNSFGLHSGVSCAITFSRIGRSSASPRPRPCRRPAAGGRSSATTTSAPPA